MTASLQPVHVQNKKNVQLISDTESILVNISENGSTSI